MVRESVVTPGKKDHKYDKLADADNLMTYGDGDEGFETEDTQMRMAPGMDKVKGGKRDHEIYDRTYYIPNDKLRLLEIPMNSNRFF
jgi:hypothetical protein